MVTKERLERNKDTQEFFTPDWAVKMMVDEAPEDFFKNLTNFYESGCGNGNIAVQVYERYRKYHDHDSIMSVFKLADLMEDNCIECIQRFYGPGEIEIFKGDLIPEHMQASGLIACFTWNGTLLESIVQADCTKYHWGESEIFGNNLFEIQN
jgi:hypothetical protein